MFAINHAATALLLKHRYPELAIAPLLLSVQVMELLWVLLNFLGIERTTTDAVVRDVSDIQLAYMPFSHSVATMVGAALLVLVAVILAQIIITLGLVGWAATRRAPPRPVAAG